MTGYTPACLLCRDSSPSYYKACQGCQERRRTAMAAFHKCSAKQLPAPSIDQSSESTQCP